MKVSIKKNLLIFGLSLILSCFSVIVSANSPDDQRPTPEEILKEKGVELISNNLIERLMDKKENEDIRYLSAMVLGRKGDKTALPYIFKILNDENEKLRNALVCALGNIADKSAISSLKNVLMKDNSESVRSMSIQALTQIGGKEVVNVLCEKLKDKNETSDNIRYNAALSLGKLRDDSSITSLKDALNDNSLDVKVGAATALSKFNDRSGIPVLISILENETAGQWLQDTAMSTLQEITGNDFGYPKKYYAPASKDERGRAIKEWIEWSKIQSQASAQPIVSPAVVEAVLSKAVDDYKNERNKHRKQMPPKVSIALVKQQDNKHPLILENNVEKHWTYENGKIIESEFSLGYGPPQFSKVSFAIFNDGSETFVQLDEGWFFFNAGGALYKVVRDSNEKINLKKINENWHE